MLSSAGAAIVVTDILRRRPAGAGLRTALAAQVETGSNPDTLAQTKPSDDQESR